jgi:hypothetical protein
MYIILKFVMGSFRLDFLLLVEGSILTDLELICLIIVAGPLIIMFVGREVPPGYVCHCVTEYLGFSKYACMVP